MDVLFKGRFEFLAKVILINDSMAVADPGFPRGEGKEGCYLANLFSQKLHEIERILTPGERVGA